MAKSAQCYFGSRNHRKALTVLLQTPTKIVGAGRTDAGVHALQMVAHFDTDIFLIAPPWYLS